MLLAVKLKIYLTENRLSRRSQFATIAKILLGGHGSPEATLSAPFTRLQPPIGVFDAHRHYAQVDIPKNDVLIMRFRT